MLSLLDVRINSRGPHLLFVDYDVALKAIFQSTSSRFFYQLVGSRPVRQINVEFVSVEKRMPDLVFELEDGRILHVELQARAHG